MIDIQPGFNVDQVGEVVCSAYLEKSILVVSRVNNGRESIQLPYTTSKMSTSSREAIL